MLYIVRPFVIFYERLDKHLDWIEGNAVQTQKVSRKYAPEIPKSITKAEVKAKPVIFDVLRPENKGLQKV